MSDFEDDIDDQLLELAGATEKKKKRRQQQGAGGKSASGGKKRKIGHMDTDSDNNVESEDEVVDPYPLEGKYKDEADKRELLDMNEFQREQILEERAGQRQSMLNAKALANIVRQQQRGGAANGEDSVSRAAKRQHTARGATKEKAQRLDELKAKRKAKDEKKRTKGDSSPRRERSSSPQDMDISDSESEDGQITKTEQEEERLLSLGSGYDSQKKRSGGKEDSAEVPSTILDLEGCRLTRDALAKHCIKPWFQDYVTGAWVRYLIGQENNGEPVYRICQVKDLASDFVKPYKINEKTINQAFELKHGKSVKTFNMDKVSNGPFLEKEYDRLVKACLTDDVKLPTKQALEKKVSQMGKLVAQPMTESDITAMLLRKSQLQGSKSAGLTTLERSSLIQKRTLAQRRHDHVEVAEIDAQLAEDAALAPQQTKNEPIDVLARVNERNRKANMESVRKAELQESERKRRERKGAAVPLDPSARLKIMPRTFTPTATRAGTPVVNEKVATLNAASAGKAPVKSTSAFEASLIDAIEIDLGDF